VNLKKKVKIMLDEIDNEELVKIPAIPSDELRDKLPKGYLSVSQVTQYMKCGEAYYFRYVMERQIPSTSFQVQGRGVHKAAEHLHLSMIQENPISEEQMFQIYEELHDNEIKDAQVDEDDAALGNLKDIGLRLTAKYRRAALGKEFNKETNENYAPVKPIAAERVVRTNIITDEGNVPFLGIIDIEEEFAIADVKTKKRAAPQAEADNSLQLSLYAHVTGKPIVRLEQLVKPTKTIGERFIRTQSVRTRQEVMHALDVVSQVAQDIAAGRFRKTNPENWWCSAKWCPYWGDCRGRKRA
jgi:hypothetical protein